MRNCPVCESSNFTVLETQRDKWARIWDFKLCECGMAYLTCPDVTQATFDDYYLNHYQSNDGWFMSHRLGILADNLMKYPRNSHILDLGASKGNEIFRSLMLERGFKHIDTLGIGEPRENYDIIVISHVLEHVYDMPDFLNRMWKHLRNKGKIVLEIPIWFSYEDRKYDFHWQHVNKFNPVSLSKLMTTYGFETLEHHQIEDLMEFNCWRYEGKKK